jgi:serine O-acetyltransferase
LTEDNVDDFIGQSLGEALHLLHEQVRRELRLAQISLGNKDDLSLESQAESIVIAFSENLPNVRALLESDVQAAFRGDPAARSVDEVLLCYPGIKAIIHHRLAHELYRLGATLIARLIAENAHSVTGIDIHPGATIGGRFFIDHLGFSVVLCCPAWTDGADIRAL